MLKLFKVYYKDSQDDNKEKFVKCCCIDKLQARKLFYSESPLTDVIIKIKEVE